MYQIYSVVPYDNNSAGTKVLTIIAWGKRLKFLFLLKNEFINHIIIVNCRLLNFYELQKHKWSIKTQKHRLKYLFGNR